jgi:hypothetical protein
VVISRYRDREQPNEAAVSVIKLAATKLKGLSFSVAELTLISSWSRASGLRMVVRLDHGSDTEEFEEVLALYIGETSLCRWIMWRNGAAVFVQPLIGKVREYHSVAEAFEDLSPKQLDILTDIKAESWPA